MGTEGSGGISSNSTPNYPTQGSSSPAPTKKADAIGSPKATVLVRIATTPNTAETIISGVGRQVRRQNDNVRKFPSPPSPSPSASRKFPSTPPPTPPSSPTTSRKFPQTAPPTPPIVDQSEQDVLDLLSSTELKVPVSTPLERPTPPPRANLQVTENPAQEHYYDENILVQEHSFSWKEFRDEAADKMSSLGSIILGGAKSALKALSDVKLGNVFSKPKPNQVSKSAPQPAGSPQTTAPISLASTKATENEAKLSYFAAVYKHLGDDLVDTIKTEVDTSKKQGKTPEPQGILREQGAAGEINDLQNFSAKATNIEEFKEKEKATLSDKRSLSKGGVYKGFLNKMPTDLKTNLKNILKGDGTLEQKVTAGTITPQEAAREFLANLEKVKDSNPHEYEILKSIIDTHASVWATKWDGLPRGDLNSFLIGSTFLVYALLEEQPAITKDTTPAEMQKIASFETTEVPKFREVAVEILKIQGSQNPEIADRFLPPKATDE